MLEKGPSVDADPVTGMEDKVGFDGASMDEGVLVVVGTASVDDSLAAVEVVGPALVVSEGIEAVVGTLVESALVVDGISVEMAVVDGVSVVEDAMAVEGVSVADWLSVGAIA